MGTSAARLLSAGAVAVLAIAMVFAGVLPVAAGPPAQHVIIDNTPLPVSLQTPLEVSANVPLPVTLASNAVASADLTQVIETNSFDSTTNARLLSIENSAQYRTIRIYLEGNCIGDCPASMSFTVATTIEGAPSPFVLETFQITGPSFRRTLIYEVPGTNQLFINGGTGIAGTGFVGKAAAIGRAN